MLLALGFSTTATAQKAVELSNAQVENIVRRSYQYVAMFNVIMVRGMASSTGLGKCRELSE